MTNDFNSKSPLAVTRSMLGGTPPPNEFKRQRNCLNGISYALLQISIQSDQNMLIPQMKIHINSFTLIIKYNYVIVMI